MRAVLGLTTRFQTSHSIHLDRFRTSKAQVTSKPLRNSRNEFAHVDYQACAPVVLALQ